MVHSPARSMAWIGGKLYYGHPDFLNALYMTTRGGVSKAQKGLHLNEDIYAGMKRIWTGSENIINVDRDAILGLERFFQTKIVTGMGETDTRSRVLLSWDPVAY